MKSKRIDNLCMGRIIYLRNDKNAPKWRLTGMVGCDYSCFNTKTGEEKLFCGSKRVFVMSRKKHNKS